MDDCLGKGPTREVSKFMEALAVRFNCKSQIYFSEGTPIDHLGMTFFKTEQGVYLTMENYIDAMMVKLNSDPDTFRRVRTPISAAINDTTTVSVSEAAYFMTGTGILGWLAFTGRPNLK